jgi:hypothetical protein
MSSGFFHGKPDPFSCAARLLQERHPNAVLAFVAGSIVRGEATRFSDIDLIIVYPRVEHAYRESLSFEGWPVECFVHDPATLRYFFEKFDAQGGDISLASMVMEGLLLPEGSALGLQLKELARAHVARGPAPWSAEQLLNARYMITDLVDDLRAFRNKTELLGTLGALHEHLAALHFRANGQWTAARKHIPRRLAKSDPALAERWTRAFEEAMAGQVNPVVALAEALLKPFGGFCFDGYKRDAPKDWRLESDTP